MKMRLILVIFVSIFLMFGCAGTLPNQEHTVFDSTSKSERPLVGVKVSSEDYLGYQPIDPIPVAKVKVFDNGSNDVKEVFWQSLKDEDYRRALLPLQTAEFAVRKTDMSGQVSYLVSSLSAERGSYEVIMDYMKYRIEDAYGVDGGYIGNARVGVGLRIKALVVTKKAELNLGSITAIGLQADLGHLSGGISVDVVGIDSEAVTNLIPLTSKIDETAIQSALQALASIKSKLWEKETTITPHIVAIRQSKPNKKEEIRKQISISTYMKSNAGDVLRKYWKPDGKNIDQLNEKNLKDWMSSNGLSVGPGSITIFLRGSEFEDLRKKAIKELNLN